MIRKPSTLITERDLMFCIAGQLYSQAPARLPRNVETIMMSVREKIRVDFANHNEWYVKRIPDDEIHTYIKELLMNIPEFVALNLSQIQYEENISPDDPNRPKYVTSDLYRTETSESWRSDFIDLDAFIKNVERKLDMIEMFEADCAGCKHGFNEKSEACKSCIANHDIKLNYEGSRRPKGNHKFNCKFDCPSALCICCEECDKQVSCEDRCDQVSSNCGNVIK